MTDEQITYRLYEPGDEVAIVRLFQAVFGRAMPLEEWRWKYTGKGNAKVNSTVAVSDKKGLVAHYGVMRHRMVYHGRDIIGLAIGDVMVDPGYRGRTLFKGVAALFPVEASKDGFFFAYGFPTSRALRLPELLGLYERVADVYASGKEVRFRQNKERFIYKLFPLGFDDARIDALWERTRDSYGLALVRDREFFDWRYRRHPLFSYELWGLRRRWSSDICGLAVLRNDGEKTLLVDYVCQAPLLEALVQKVENAAFAAGRKRLELWHPERLRQKMLGLGFTVQYADTSIPRSTHEGWLTKEQIADNFFFTMGDTDFL